MTCNPICLDSAEFSGSLATFVSLNIALTSLGKALQLVAENMLDVLISTSKIDELIKLCDLETDERRDACKDRQLPLEAHARLASDVDGLLRRSELNAADAHATAALLAEVRLLEGFGAKGYPTGASADAGGAVAGGAVDLRHAAQRVGVLDAPTAGVRADDLAAAHVRLDRVGRLLDDELHAHRRGEMHDHVRAVDQVDDELLRYQSAHYLFNDLSARQVYAGYCSFFGPEVDTSSIVEFRRSGAP